MFKVIKKDLGTVEKIYPIEGRCIHSIETSQLIYTANQLFGFYMMGILAIIVLTIKKQPPGVFCEKRCS